MRQRRLKAPTSFPVAHYHCMSRVVNRDFLFGPQEREHFVRLLREYERFCGVRVLTFCILSNHFHLLLEVPARPTEPLNADEVLAKLEALSSSALTPKRFRQIIDQFRAAKDAAGERAFLNRICTSMWDVSGYLQRLKQRFTQWYNRRSGRRGVLWEERFRSVLVEGSGDPLSTMAAYIDLNPVRAGLVTDPKDYRWCGYGAAAAGDATAREAIGAIIAMAQRSRNSSESTEEQLATYRIWLFGQGEERLGTAPDGGSTRRGFSREAVLAVLAARGRVSMPEYLHLRVRYFADGAVLGSREFVDGVFVALRERWGPKRMDGARPVRGVESDLCVLRDLRKQVLG